ncbi:ArsR/SmtB family transcription factor [Thermoflavimicrobium daqui]|uniref:ArsR family transcriptional regulator n=1 Tax=Thermoflavimicrobium daqui TaxID=2137476 RepID=A0A364K454_9BACL|nr:helix-turn-helix transcriptional regulator [Thermoflavimicrobium daqui]RAL24150.1 ArsR family transcriptional regulator [Thermoflavimicrobium daqui]
MDTLLIFKALSNEKRLLILQWLKNPKENFIQPQHLTQHEHFDGGVCVGNIQKKAGLAQSVISGYLDMMQKAGLLESKRIGKWTYYRRNEKVIQEFANFIKKEL